MAGGSRFRLPYKKRKFYYRNNRDQPLINTHVQSLVNPFDTKNGQPKWPDGLATYSIGRRHQLTTEVYAKNFYVILFPGAINWCVAFSVNPDKTNCYVWANHTANISVNYEFNPSTAIRANTAGVTNKAYELHVPHDAFSHWRNVATACHIQVINTTDSNEGWFRAARINRTRENVTMFDTICGFGTQYGNGNNILQTPHFHVGGLIPSESLLADIGKILENQPSLCVGELQDIHNAVFQLNNIKDRNEFKTLKTETLYEIQGEDGPRVLYKRDDPVPTTVNFLCRQAFDTPGAQAYYTSRSEYGLLSDSKDIIILQVLGADKTKVLLHSVNNQEFLCPDNSQLAQYVTPCQYDKYGLQRFNDNRSNYHKFPYHYLANLEQTEKALPGVFYTAEKYHYDG